MPTQVRKFAVHVALLAASLAATAQQKINPITQINWPVITGSGAPATVGVACGANNYGQPYLNIGSTPNTLYNCGNAGWQQIGAVAPIVYTGTWSGATTYTLNNAVYYAGSQYISLQNGNVNQNPATATTYWALLISGAAGGTFPATSNLIKGTGTANTGAAATPGTDYLVPGTLPNGTTATTQANGDNSTKLATDAFVLANVPTGGGCAGSTGGCVQVPRKPLQTWQQCLNNSAYQVCRVMFIGDSFDVQSLTNHGTGPIYTKNVTPNKIRALLQAKYGSHGTGITPVIGAEGSFINTDYWALSGTYVVTNILGPAQGSTTTNGTIIQMSAGAVATFTRGASGNSDAIPYDTMNTVCVDTSSSSAITVRIDGTTVGTCGGTSSGSPVFRYTASSAVTLGNHTATFTCASGTCYLYAADGSAGSVGVSVDNIAVGSYAAGAYGLTPTAQLALATVVIPQGVVFEHLTNEPGQSESQGQFATYTQNVITFVQGLSTTAPPSVIINVTPIDVIGTTAPLSTYTTTLLGVAATNNVALINEQDRWNPPGCSNGSCYVPTSGLWAIAGDAAPGIHPNDKGAQDRAQMEFDTLAATAPTTTQQAVIPLTLTTIGSTGPATYNAVTGVLNIPNYTPPCPANFCFSLTPSTISYVPGLAPTQSATPITIAQTAFTGYTSTVTYSTTGVPGGMTATVAPTTIAGGTGTAIVTASFPFSQPSGNNNFTVPGTDGTNTHTQTETLSIGTENNNLAQGWQMFDGSGSTAVSVPSGNNLGLANTTWATSSGFPASALVFNGTTSVATAANDTNTNFDGSSAFSAACWIKPASLALTDQYFLDSLNQTTGAGAWWGIQVSGAGSLASAAGSITVHMTDGTQVIDIYTGGNVVGTATPSLVGFNYDGSKTAAGVSLYVNGALASSTTSGTSFTGSLASGTPIILGQLLLSIQPAGSFGGVIGACRIASRALTTGEWAALYGAGPQ